ncbi:MAG TPA: ParB/RepB/Spo0J family partition protein [Acidobacteriota bacterium]
MRKVLGRGLETLLPPGAEAAPTGLREIEIDRIEPNRQQPRRRFDPGLLGELVASIKENGILQPLIVRRHGSAYRLVAGERRWRAAQAAGLTKVPAIVRELSDARALELALVENLQRADLSPIEEASAYQQLLTEHGLTQEQVAKRVGKARASISNSLRLLKLAPEIQAALDRGDLTAGHAKALLGMEPAAQKRLFQRIVSAGLSVRAVEQLAGGKPRRVGKPARQAGAKDPFIRGAESELHERLGTPVRIVPGKGGKGRIEIAYVNAQELERLYRFLIAD